MSIIEELIRGYYPLFLQSWYADDFSTSGAGAHFTPTIAHSKALGAARDFFFEPNKSQFLKSLRVS